MKALVKNCFYCLDIVPYARYPQTLEYNRSYNEKAEMQIEKYRYEASAVSFNNHIKFKDFSKEWFEMEVKGRKSLQTQRNYDSDLRNYVLPIVAEIKLRDINIRHARLMKNNMLDKRSIQERLTKFLPCSKKFSMMPQNLITL